MRSCVLVISGLISLAATPGVAQADLGALFGGILQGAIRAEQQRYNTDRTRAFRRQRSSPEPDIEHISNTPASSSDVARSPMRTKINGDGPYRVDGITLGSVVSPDDLEADYSCVASSEFQSFSWCRKPVRKGDKFTQTSVLHSNTGVVVYANRSVTPANFAPGEIDTEVKRLSAKFNSPARIMSMPHRSNLRDGMIATWGDITLAPLDSATLRLLATNKKVSAGLLLDYLNDIRASAKQGLPVYRISGGAGFLWAATYDRSGRGALRFGAVDASAYEVPATRVESTADAGLPRPVVQAEFDTTNADSDRRQRDLEEARAAREAATTRPAT